MRDQVEISSQMAIGPRARYVAPLKVCVLVSVLGEATILLIWGIILFPEGSQLRKFLWTVVFCGIGMGSVLGCFVTVYVVDRMSGARAVAAVALASFILLGIGCDALCYNLDAHYFHYFGGLENPVLFLSGGSALSLLGGFIIGLLLFTERGRLLLARARIQ